MHSSTRPPAAALAAIVLAAIALSACGDGTGGSANQGEGKAVEVVATTTQVADLVRNVGGDRVDVAQVLKPGSDPHGFEPRPSDVVAAASASLVFSNGANLDPWAEQLVSDSGSEAELIDLSASQPDLVAEEDDHGHAHEHDSEFDPHWWHNPKNAVVAVETISAHLSEVDPEGKATYTRNARTFSRRIKQLDAQIASCIERIPPARRKLVTDHEAFDHLAHRYGLELIGAVIPALTTQAQPSARDLSELAAAISREGAPAIFPEASLSPKLAEAIAGQTGASAAHTLYGDSLGPANSDGATYLGMMAANARAIVEGLGEGEVKCELVADE